MNKDYTPICSSKLVYVFAFIYVEVGSIISGNHLQITHWGFEELFSVSLL